MDSRNIHRERDRDNRDRERVRVSDSRKGGEELEGVDVEQLLEEILTLQGNNVNKNYENIYLTLLVAPLWVNIK